MLFSVSRAPTQYRIEKLYNEDWFDNDIVLSIFDINHVYLSSYSTYFDKNHIYLSSILIDFNINNVYLSSNSIEDDKFIKFELEKAKIDGINRKSRPADMISCFLVLKQKNHVRPTTCHIWPTRYRSHIIGLSSFDNVIFITRFVIFT